MNNEQWGSGDPFEHFQRLYSEALEKEDFDATRAAFATVDTAGQPMVRFLLIRRVDSRGCVFYTDYRSRKAKALEHNPKGALAWHWSSIGVQIRMEGDVSLAEPKLSDEYFSGRSRGSQLSAWASHQSSFLENRASLETKRAQFQDQFEGEKVSRPSHWGGYRMIPSRIEFWFNRDDRLHDRFEYVRVDSGWMVSRLSP